MRIVAAISSALLLSAFSATPSRAAWPTPPGQSLPVCTAVSNQIDPWVAADGAGGAFIAWADQRSNPNESLNAWDIYVQHVLASGSVDPAWPVNGRGFVIPNSDQRDPRVVADGAGGVIVIWSGYVNGGTLGIYAGHVLASGVVDPSWPVNGRTLSTPVGPQSNLLILADGAGGAFVAWWDHRAGNGDAYAHHILANGVADPAFPANGLAISTGIGHQLIRDLVSDGAGGALVSWDDRRSGVSFDSYVGHLTSSGALDPAWPSGGLAVCALAGDQSGGVMRPDGAGGAILAWGDYRPGSSGVYAHHVLGTGIVDPAWPVNGRAVSTLPPSELPKGIVSDGAGGVIVTWSDGRDGDSDVYAQHVTGSGVVDPAWPVNGRALCTSSDEDLGSIAAPDGAGGALVVWRGWRFGVRRMLVHRVSASGIVEPAWATDGEPVELEGTFGVPTGSWRAIPGDFGSMIVTWDDYRTGRGDIYAQRMTPPDGVVAALASLVSSRWTGAAAELAWQGDALAGAQVAVYREENRAGWTQIATVTGDGEGFARFTDPNVVAGREYGYRIGMPLDGAEVFAGETRIAIPAVGLAIQAVSPNPARGGRLGLRATFEGTGPARARVLDLSGRVVLERDVATGSGGAELDLGGAALRPGVYVLELVQGSERATARFTYLK